MTDELPIFWQVSELPSAHSLNSLSSSHLICVFPYWNLKWIRIVYKDLYNIKNQFKIIVQSDSQTAYLEVCIIVICGL